MRLARSASRSSASRQSQGPPTRRSAPATAPGASRCVGALLSCRRMTAPSACAIPAQTPASARSSVSILKDGSGINSSYGAGHLHLADTDVRLEHELALARLGDVPVDVPPVGGLPEHLHLPELRIAVHAQRDVARHDDPEVADVDTRPDIRFALGELDVAQVEGHVADAQLVAAAQVL